MNVDEYIRTKVNFEELGGRLTSLQGKFVYSTPDGATHGFGVYPAAGPDSIADIGLATIAQHVSLTGRAHAMTKDRRFTAEGRDQELAPHYGAGLTVVALAGDQLAKHRTDITALRAQLFAPPAIDGKDFAAVMADVELRNYFRSLSGKDLEGARIAMASGQADDMMAALLRSKVPIGEAGQMVKRAWDEGVRRRHPADVAQLDAKDASLAWSTQVVGQIGHHIKKLTSWPDQKIYEHVAPTGGWRIFGFQDRDVANWETLRAAAASTSAA